MMQTTKQTSYIPYLEIQAPGQQTCTSIPNLRPNCSTHYELETQDRISLICKSNTHPWTFHKIKIKLTGQVYYFFNTNGIWRGRIEPMTKDVWMNALNTSATTPAAIPLQIMAK